MTPKPSATPAEQRTHEHTTPCECGTNAYYNAGDEYGSLADGGSYQMCDCSNCGKRVYVPLPD